MVSISAHAMMTCAEMAEADRQTIASGRFTGFALMERAGAAIADLVLDKCGDARTVHVLCGPGNNGGDGYVVARLLAKVGVLVRLYASGAPKVGTDAALAAEQWSGLVEPLTAVRPDVEDCVVDALFGAGFHGQLPQEARAALERCARSGTRAMAVDLPSGINGDTGLGDCPLRAVQTVTFYRRKPAHCIERARDRSGEVVVADIGVRWSGTPSIWQNHPDLWSGLMPLHTTDTYKYRRGHVAVFSGSPLSTGASRLAAIAAAETGAGAVTLIGSEDALKIHAAHVTAIMLKQAVPGSELNALQALNKPGAAVLGPGFGVSAATRELALSVISYGRLPLVLDADGLTSFEGDPEQLFEAIKAAHSTVILTPHEGEFARLFPRIASDFDQGRLQKAQAAAAMSGAVVVFKGPDTIIASPDGRAVINNHASSSLATAGSGDVLSGIIASLCAQGMDGFWAAAAAVWLHGDAGVRAGHATTADHLPALANRALNALLEFLPANGSGVSDELR